MPVSGDWPFWSCKGGAGFILPSDTGIHACVPPNPPERYPNQVQFDMKPAKPRAIVSHDAGLLKIVIPARRQWFAMIFLSFWLCGWLVGELTALVILLSGKAKGPPIAFLVFWLTFWTLGGTLALLNVLWMAAGREVITLEGPRLVIRQEIFGRGLTRTFDVARIRFFRVSPVYRRGGFPFGLGLVAFDYGAKTYRFGIMIEEAEAGLLIEQLRGYLPPNVM